MPTSNLIRVVRTGLLLLLGACVPQQNADELHDATDGTVQMRRVVLQRDGRDVVIAPPRGFCLDPDSVQDGAVLAGNCLALGIIPLGVPSDTLAIMSASVSHGAIPGQGTLIERVTLLEMFLQTGRMNELLAEDSGIARLVETRLHGDTVYALVEDNEVSAFAGASKRYWRALSEVNGRMVVLTLRALDVYWPGEQALLERAIAFRESIRRANPAVG